jgi:Flp pilus assembly protein TadG
MAHWRQRAGARIVREFAAHLRAGTRERISRIRQRLQVRAKSGSAAVEFAFIAPVLFVFLMGTLEVGIMFIGQFALQNSVTDAARQIRTGQAQVNSITQADFRQLICNKISPILACDANLQVDVETYPTFGAASFTNPLKADQTLDSSLNKWQPGAECSIVLVRVFYTWNVATPVLTPFMVNMANSQHLMSATVAFRNEPYTTAVAGC